MDNPFTKPRGYDKFENGTLTTTGCFDRHKQTRNEQSLMWLARQNEMKLDVPIKDMDMIIFDVLRKLTKIEPSVDEKLTEYLYRIDTNLIGKGETND